MITSDSEAPVLIWHDYDGQRVVTPAHEVAALLAAYYAANGDYTTHVEQASSLPNVRLGCQSPMSARIWNALAQLAFNLINN